jgi:hypothetical protein
MSRLYYESPLTRAAMAGAGAPAKEYMEKIAKLIPAEIIAGYVTLVGLVPLIKAEWQWLYPWFYLVIFLLSLVLTPIYLYAQADAGKPKRVHLIISTIAFVIWAYAVSGGSVCPAYYDSAVASIFLGVFSLVSGKIPLH